MLDAALEIPGFDAAMVASTRVQANDDRDARDDPGRGCPSAFVGRRRDAAGPITVSYRYGAADAADTQLIRGGLFVPLVSRDGNALGARALLADAGLRADAERIAAIEQIAATSIPAIENARRYREARQMAETDALTGFNQRYFHETLRREALRAQRYDRRLARSSSTSTTSRP